MLNIIQIIGFAGKDPIPGKNADMPMCRFSVAVTERWKDNKGNKKEDTDWFTVVVFGKLSEVVMNMVKKGTKVYVQGKLKHRNWKTESGEERSSYEIVCDKFLVLSEQKTSQPSSHVKEEEDEYLL